jgi:hypothetical protein
MALIVSINALNQTRLLVRGRDRGIRDGSAVGVKDAPFNVSGSSL